MNESYPLTSHFTYFENRDDVTQWVKVNLEGNEINVDGLKRRINCVDKQNEVFAFEGKRKLVYATEALTPDPEANKGGINLLLLLGNPAIHSVAEGMFFSYEKTRMKGKVREHRFWKTLRSKEVNVLKFHADLEDPTPENNKIKRDCLLSGCYESQFNLFLLPYFSFPTPASKDYNGVAGIKKIFCDRDKDRRDIFFKEMLDFEFCRFKHVVSSNKITNVICFQKGAWDEIIEKSKDANLISNQRDVPNELQYPVYQIWLSDKSSKLTLYRALSTRLILTVKSKKLLAAIIRDIAARANSASPR